MRGRSHTGDRSHTGNWAMTDHNRPSITVIVPMYNAAHLIDRCFQPILGMLERGEIQDLLVVDDCSTDGGGDVLRERGIRVLRSPRQGGPGAARNLAVGQVDTDYVWFIDSDVVAADDAGRVLREVLATGRPAAVVGSYDNTPAAENFLSQYKNLIHHYYHHRASDDASTFWAGCGVVRRDVFVQVGGFDEERFPYPSIEDIDLGYRIREAGGAIAWVSRFQGKHLKEWRLVNLVHTEVFRRAIPWSKLMLERSEITDDLNVSSGERVRAGLAGLTLLALLLWAVDLMPGAIVLGLAAGLVAFNWEMLSFFNRERGPWFALRAFLYHQFYYVYSSASFAWAWACHQWQRLTSAQRAVRE